MTSKFLLGFIGIPSIGKTTFAKNLANKFEEEGYPIIIIGSDDIRNMIPKYNKNFKHEREQIVREMTLNLIKDSLEHGFNVINDDLNYYKSMRHDLFEIANQYDSFFFSIYFKIPLEIALERNENRGSTIPNSVIKNIFEKLDKPGDYKWDEPIKTFESINFTDTNLVNQTFSKILTKIKEIREKQDKKIISKPGKSEFLDKLTRQLINELVSKQNHKKFSKDLSMMRKAILKKAKEENLNIQEVKTLFSKQITDFLIKSESEI